MTRNLLGNAIRGILIFSAVVVMESSAAWAVQPHAYSEKGPGEQPASTYQANTTQSDRAHDAFRMGRGYSVY